MSDDLIRRETQGRISLWQREIVTEMETSCGLLGLFAFAILDGKDSKETIREAIATVPDSLLNAMRNRVLEAQTESGDWRWPPCGPGLADPGGLSEWRLADGDKVRVMEELTKWLDDLVS